MNLKKIKILGTIIAFMSCFVIHFLYDKIPCFITSIIAPVNESIWEHMKIIVTSILFSGILQKIYIKHNHLGYKNVCVSNVISAIISVILFLIIYIPIYNIIGENFIFTIILLFIIISLSQIISYLIITEIRNLNFENKIIPVVFIIYIIFGILTYFPPKYELFKDPVTQSYGIKK